MIKLTDVRIDAPSNSAHNILCDIVSHCGIESVLLSLSEIVAAQPGAQSDGLRSMSFEYQQEIGDVVTKKVGVIRRR